MAGRQRNRLGGLLLVLALVVVVVVAEILGNEIVWGWRWLSRV